MPIKDMTHQEFFKKFCEHNVLIYTPTNRELVSMEDLYQQFAARLKHEVQTDMMQDSVQKANDKIAQRRKPK